MNNKLTTEEEMHLTSTLNDNCPICMSIRAKILNKHFPDDMNEKL